MLENIDERPWLKTPDSNFYRFYLSFSDSYSWESLYIIPGYENQCIYPWLMKWGKMILIALKFVFSGENEICNPVLKEWYSCGTDF